VFYAFRKEGAKAGALVNCALSLGDAEISTSPVLLQGCEESAKKTDDETQEPQCVYPDGRGRWLERGYRGGLGRDLGPIGNLLGYLCEDGDSVAARVWQ
jgi:hypothetical protein